MFRAYHETGGIRNPPGPPRTVKSGDLSEQEFSEDVFYQLLPILFMLDSGPLPSLFIFRLSVYMQENVSCGLRLTQSPQAGFPAAQLYIFLPKLSPQA